jgi:hypothetical protein
MRVIFLLVLLSLVCSAPALAGDVYIPSQAFSGSGNVIPMNGAWPSSSNPNGEWRYQTHLDASWIGQAGLITDMAFLPSYAGTALTTPTFEIRMSHTTLAAPTSNFDTNLPNPVVVYPKGPFTWNPTQKIWSNLGLRAPFPYNGKDNLTIEIRYMNGVATGTLACDTNSSNAKAPYRTYKYGPGAYTTATPSTTGSRAGLKIRLTFADVMITGSGSPSVGGTVKLDLVAPADAGLPYQVGTSLGNGPIPIDTRFLNLSPDSLLVVTVNGYLPAVFQNYAGLLDTSGKGQATIHIPNLPPIIGVRLYSAFVTVKATAPSGLETISPTYDFTITK